MQERFVLPNIGSVDWFLQNWHSIFFFSCENGILELIPGHLPI
jgi:hypothetical protein